MKKNYSRNRKNKKTVTLLFIALAVVLLASWFFYHSSRNDNTETNDGPAINYAPPTDEESLAGDEQKDKIINQNSSSNRENSDQQSATVLITDAAQYGETIEVRSWISDHFENGTCTLQFTSGSIAFARETPAYTDASSTICTNPLIKRSDFPQKGTWTVVVNYKSASTSVSGQSQEVSFEVK